MPWPSKTHGSASSWEQTMSERLKQLANDDTPSMSAAELDELAQLVVEQAPKEASRRRVQRVAVVCTIAAAATIMLVLLPRTDDEQAPEIVVDGRDCAQRPAPTRRADTVDLAQAGRVTFQGEVDVDWRPCEWTLTLHEGSLRVEADDLGGGTLQVLAGPTTVTVRGTVFSVERHGDDVAVRVEHGRVEVSREDWQVVVHEGQRVDARGVVTALVEADTETETEPADIETPTPARTPTELVLQAERERLGGNLTTAEALYRRAGRGEGPDAEAAWLALARMSQSRGRVDAALRAVRSHRRRFGRGALSAEVLALGFRIARDAGRSDVARGFARELRRDHAETPHARAAIAWLDQHP